MVNAVNCIRIIGIRISFDLGMARGYTLKARRYNAYTRHAYCVHINIIARYCTQCTHIRGCLDKPGCRDVENLRMVGLCLRKPVTAAVHFQSHARGCSFVQIRGLRVTYTCNVRCPCNIQECILWLFHKTCHLTHPVT